MLATYLSRTQTLLQNPSAPTTLYSQSDLYSYINQARGQLAGESESVRYLATVSTTIGARNINFSALSTGTASVTGISGVLHVRAVRYAVASGYKWMTPRAWPWFDFFHMSNPVPPSGPPNDWAQYSQGASGGGSITGIGSGSLISGSLYVDPVPDLVYVLTCDCVCYPQLLTADTDVEAIPFLFTDAVPYFAAYLALLGAEANTRMADAERYFGYYQTFLQRARTFSNPSVLRNNYEQAVDQTQLNKLGLQPRNAQGGG